MTRTPSASSTSRLGWSSQLVALSSASPTRFSCSHRPTSRLPPRTSSASSRAGSSTRARTRRHVSIVGGVIEALLWTFIALLWVRFVVDWVQVFARSWSPHGVLLVTLEGVYSTTDPPIKALRRVIPPLRIGSVALDLSFLIVMIAAYVLLRVNREIFFV